MKKTYLKPTMMVVKLQHQGIICTSDVIRGVNSDAGIGYGGGGRGSARVRGREEVDWDDYE